MGLLKGDDYREKPADMSIFKDYSNILDTNTIKETELSNIIATTTQKTHNMNGSGANVFVCSPFLFSNYLIHHISVICTNAGANGFFKLFWQERNGGTEYFLAGCYVAANANNEINFSLNTPIVIPNGAFISYTTTGGVACAGTLTASATNS